MNSIKNFKDFSVFVECSTGNTPTVNALKKYIDILSQFGYNVLYLGLTDAYKIKGEPYFNFCRGGYTTEQLQEIDKYAKSKGIELRANIQTLAHLDFMQRHRCYSDMFDIDGILLAGDERVYAFIDKMFATMSEGISSRTIHIGLDEAWRLGLGQYLTLHGYTEKKVILLSHLQRVVEIARKFDYICEIWSDMFYRLVAGSDFNDDGVIPEDVRSSIPEGVRLTHWSYEQKEDALLRKQLQQNKSICDEVILAASAWKQIGLAPYNEYSIGAMERQIPICIEEGIDRYMITLWSDNGAHCSIFAVLPALFAATEMAKGKKREEIDKARFKEIVGVEFDDFMLLDNLNNPFFKENPDINARCLFGLYSDVFLGSADLLLDPRSNEAYAALAEKYAQIDGGEYQLIFNDYKLYAKVLSIKMNLGVQTRKAYREGNKALLTKYATEEIPQLILYLQEYIENFNERWLSENMGIGLEVHHMIYGGQLERLKYVAKRLLQHVEDGKPIDEMERDELPPSYDEGITEDNCWAASFKTLVTSCHIY